MLTHKEIVEELGGYQEVSRCLRVHLERVRFWAIRDSIPPEFWADVVDLGRAKGKPGISMRMLSWGRKRRLQQAS